MGKTSQRKRSAFELGVEHAKKTGRGWLAPKARGPIAAAYINGVKAGLASLAPAYSPDYADGAEYADIILEHDINMGLWRWLKRIALLAVMVIAALIASGCATTSMTTPDGYTAHYTRWGDQSVQGLRFERDNLGVVRVVLEKQASEAKILDAIGALVGAAR